MFASLRGRLISEFTYLANFVRDLLTRSFSQRALRARLRLYGGAVRGTYNEARFAAMRAAGFTEMRRVLHPADHCDPCVEWAGRGWQPIGTMPLPTQDTPCGNNCRCTVEYR